MSLRLNKQIKDTDEIVMLSSLVINIVSGIPGVSYFINIRPENILFKLLRTRLSYL